MAIININIWNESSNIEKWNKYNEVMREAKLM